MGEGVRSRRGVGVMRGEGEVIMSDLYFIPRARVSKRLFLIL